MNWWQKLGAFVDQGVAFFAGKKTYIVALVMAGTAFADYMGWPIPKWVYAGEMAVFGTTFRAALAKTQSAAESAALAAGLPVAGAIPTFPRAPASGSRVAP